MLLKVLLVLKTGNFSDWIGSRVACNAPVSRVGGGGSGEGGARVSNDWCIIFAGWRVNQVGFEGFHPQKVEKFFSGFNISNVYSLIFSLVFYLGEGN